MPKKTKTNKAHTDSRYWLTAFSRKKSEFWLEQEHLTLHGLYEKLTSDVAAYSAFLKQQGYKKRSRRADFSQLPAPSKKSYFIKYAPIDLRPVRERNLPSTLTATSGSTGAPTYFYRDSRADFAYSIFLEYFLQPYKNKRTLFIDCFGMGVWIGGLLTFTALRETVSRGYPVDVITPGVSIKDILASVVKLTDDYDSVVLAGYPPFIKDVVDNPDFPQKLLRSGKLRFIFAAESFTEGFRDYLVKKCAVKNKYTDTLNIYGSAELGAMAVETPLSIVCRELVLKSRALSDLFLPGGKIPTMAQYCPNFTTFTEREGRLLVSGDSVTPFLLYDIGDSGKVLSFSAFSKHCKEAGIDLVHELRKKKVQLCELPFVFVYERVDLSASLYGLQIYPQSIKQALEKYVDEGVLTGKFILSTERDKKQNQVLEIKVEAGRGAKKLPKGIQEHIRTQLLVLNSEYRELSKFLPVERLTPRVILCNNGDPNYFRVGIKQKWVQR